MTRNDLILSIVIALLTLLPIPVMSYLMTDPPYYIPIYEPVLGLDVRVPPSTRPSYRDVVCPFWVPKMRVDPLRWRHTRGRRGIPSGRSQDNHRVSPSVDPTGPRHDLMKFRRKTAHHPFLSPYTDR